MHAERYKMEVDLLQKNGICMLAHDQTLRWGRKVVEDKMAPYLLALGLNNGSPFTMARE
ncbi:hypothetical protein T10_6990 [Trichinella papuae]|uniref:Uncharacterized protein n=1 Tax=Trichinella papuae TaxID=268474 RepID=A0A0V1LY97_9BILA|nr:hypothetical protein T10_6990 [Trichinella papuae]